MNKTDMRNALRAFERCKGKLARTANEINHGKRAAYICFALGNSARSFYARRIVMASISPAGTYDVWLRTHGFPGLTVAQVQRERHRFVNVCIAELKRRLKA